VHKFSKNLKINLTILGNRRVMGSKYHVHDSQILRATVQHLVITANWLPECAQSCFRTTYPSIVCVILFVTVTS